MAIIENLSTLESSNAALSVTLHQNHFRKDGTYYARVSRNTATFNNVISEIAEENKGLDPHLLQYSAILIQKKILKMLEQGKAVNILDLGTMYIAMKCSAKGKNDVSNNGKFCIKFSPTQIAQDTVNSLMLIKWSMLITIQKSQQSQIYQLEKLIKQFQKENLWQFLEAN